MKIQPLFLVLVLAYLSACTPNTVKHDGIKTINLNESKDMLPISSFIDKIDYLELLVNEANIGIGEILSVKVIADDLIIKQRWAKEISFLRFAKDGHFISKVVSNKSTRIGQPFDVVAYKKNFAVLSENGVHLVTKTGEYIEKLLDSEVGASLFLLDKSNFYMIDETQPDNFLVECAKKQKVHLDALVGERYKRLIYRSISSLGKNNYHIVSSFSDRVLSFSNGKLQPAYDLNPGRYPSLKTVWENSEHLEGREKQRYIYETQYVTVKKYLENKDYIFIDYWVGSKATSVLIRKDDWKPLYFGRAVNNIDGGIWEKPLYLSNKNELYVPLSAMKISCHKISDKRNRGFEKLQTQFTASGNPVIMKCHLE